MWHAYKIDKTKTMVFGSRLEENDAVVCINETVLENVESFVYLSSEFTWNNNCSRETQRTTGVYGDLRPIWKDTSLSTKIKIQLLQRYYYMQQKRGPRR